MSSLINKISEPYQINTLDEAVSWLKISNKNESEITCRGLLELGIKGSLNIYASVNMEELSLFNPEGQEIMMLSDGLLPLTKMQCHYLAINKSAAINNFEMTDGLSGKTEKLHFINPVPLINEDDLRVKGIDLLNLIKSPTKRIEQKIVEIDSQNDKKSIIQDALEVNAELAAYFDPVFAEDLETMFPDENKWKTTYCRRAKEMGLNYARVERKKYNPYLAGLWWLKNRSPYGWCMAKLYRRLAANLPPRTKGNEYIFTGNLD